MSEILAKQPTNASVTLQTSLNLGDNTKEKVIMQDINYFSKSSTMQKLKKDLAVSRKVRKFVDKVNGILEFVETLQCENKVELVFLFVLQSAEDYFDPSHEELKREVCKKLLSKYVNGDEALCHSFMNLAGKNIKKSTSVRRAKKKLGNLFNILFRTS